ncbi:DNA-directed RNA polymerase III subunit RPC4 isoform X1 [Osmerus mordax]|uniref:DNA-directed RNA polymerase III subunit RPC4 isoform X1 n=1 Tax=Osmerus mordax TaxID=8014 RepID=UPI00350F597E
MTDPSDAAGSPGTSNCRPSLAQGTAGLAVRTLSSPPPPPGRLTSLRSRDLTLGGFKKKTFVPNVQAVRKSKEELREESNFVPKKDRREREERHRENRGKRRERPATIQSTSIFEQGPADTIRKTAGWRARDLSDSGTSPLAKCVKKEKHDSEEDEDEILNKLQRDDFLDDPGLKNDDSQRPIQLPLYQSSSFLKTDAPATCITDKEEMTPEPAVFKAPTSRTPKVLHGGAEVPRPEQPSVAQLFQDLSLSEREELLFIQLPDTIPGRPNTAAASEKPVKKDSKTEDKRSAHGKTHEATVRESVPVLSDFSEGFMGKLQIRKSGKVQLVLGDVTMDVSEGAAFSFLQQLVSVRISEGLAGDMCVLGNVHHKLVCSPDFEALLQGFQPSKHKPSSPF